MGSLVDLMRQLIADATGHPVAVEVADDALDPSTLPERRPAAS